MAEEEKNGRLLEAVLSVNRLLHMQLIFQLSLELQSSLVCILLFEFFLSACMP